MKGRNYQQGRKTEIVGGDVREDGDSKCGRCKGYVDEGLQCDTCQRWFHMQCEQVNREPEGIQEDLRYGYLSDVALPVVQG